MARGSLIPVRNRLFTVRSLEAGEWAFVEKRALCAEPGTWRLHVAPSARLFNCPDRLGDRLRLYCYIKGEGGAYYVSEEEIGDYLIAEDPFMTRFRYPVAVISLDALNECCKQPRLAAGG